MTIGVYLEEEFSSNDYIYDVSEDLSHIPVNVFEYPSGRVSISMDKCKTLKRMARNIVECKWDEFSHTK